MQLGTVESIWRYPVKGMRGEEIPYVYTAFSGLMGDRVYGLIAADGHAGFPWHTGREQEDLVLYKARYKSGDALLVPKDLSAFEGFPPGVHPVYPDADAFAVEVETPAGDTYDIDSAEFMRELEKASNRTLRLHVTQRGQHDSRPISIFSHSAVRELSEATGMDVDKRRFRANFYVEWEDQDDPFFEFSLVGKTLKIGERLEVAIVERDPRCKMISLDPDTAEKSPALLKYVKKNHAGCAGVFAAVLQDGRVNQGDAIMLK
ncbi:MAG: hypothetical protein ACI9BW_003578 [Gammaproteobacteria bacterium]